jgi:hypothetical protein
MKERTEVMQYINKMTRRGLAAALVLAIIAAVCVMVVLSAAPAVASITVTDSSSKIYADNGTTVISGALDLFVTAVAGVDYYELQAGYADVYYIGDTDAIEGSYFKPPFEYGALVTTVGGNISVSPKTILSSENNRKVSIPALAPGETYDIRIAAVKEGSDDVVYGHRFVGGSAAGFAFTAEFVGDSIVTTAYAASQAQGIFLVAVYKDGKLEYAQSQGFDADLSDSKVFKVDLAEQPIGVYEYKAFCWGTDYVPLALAISPK